MAFVDFYTLTQPTSLTFSAPFSSQARPTSLFLPGAFILMSFLLGHSPLWFCLAVSFPSFRILFLFLCKELFYITLSENTAPCLFSSLVVLNQR